MKKLLISSLFFLIATAFVTSSCQRDEFSGDLLEAKKQTFDNVFKSEFGDIDPNQTWGFSIGDITRGHNANANEWAATYNVPDPLTAEQKDIVRQYFQQNKPIAYNDPQWTDYFVQQVYKGGTNTTDSKSSEQYKSANDGWVVGSDHMDHLDAVFANGTHDHINNFNFGTCSTNLDVLDKGQPINGGTTHSDEIMLMVNSTTNKFGYFNSDGSQGHTDFTGLVSWTVIRDWANGKGLNGNCLNDGWNRSFMGFDFEQVVGDDVYAHNENGTVRYATYADCPSFDYVWDGQATTQLGTTASQTSIIGNFNNKWGGDEESFEWADGVLVYNAKQWGGLVYYPGGQDWSPYSKLVVEFAESVPCWTQVLVGSESAGITAGNSRIEFDFSGKDMSNVQQVVIQLGDAGTVRISNVYLVHKLINPNELIIVDGQPIPMLVNETNQYCGINGDVDQNDYRINKPVLLASGNTQDWGCLNNDIIRSKVRAGYLPVVSSTMCKWVKVQGGADGYFSDWIVTLTEAKRIGDNPQSTKIVLKEYGRVFCEDLGQVSDRDMDYNDVVFDAWIYVKQTLTNGIVTNEVPYRTDIKLWAAGGTLTLQVAGEEVHSKFGVSTGTMINTYTEASNLSSNSNYVTGLAPVSYTSSIPYSRIIDIPIVVRYSNNQIMELECNKGDAPHKFLVPIGTAWAAERVEISEAYPDFDKWVSDRTQVPWSNCVGANIYIDEDNGRKNLTFKTEDYCAAKWDASTSTLTWGHGGWNSAWTFMAAKDVYGDLSRWMLLHLKVSDFTNASAQQLTVVFRKNDGSNPPSGPTKEFVVSPDASGNIDILLYGVDWGDCDITNIQDLTIYGCARDDNSQDASVNVTEAYYIEF